MINGPFQDQLKTLGTQGCESHKPGAARDKGLADGGFSADWLAARKPKRTGA